MPYKADSTSTSRTGSRELSGIMPAVPPAENGKVLIAGPCSAESLDQTLHTAQALSAHGVKVFRAGIWKPRTHPGCFEGFGETGLQWLNAVKESTGMLTATEVASPAHVEAALAAGVDILWLGARTTTNPFAVQDIADALKGTGAAVLVKNPANTDLELWIGAIQRIYNAGIRRISAVHRGFSSYGNTFYRNPPQWQIPIELHRRMPWLQLICDPSHIGGKRALVAPIAQQAYDLGFDGLMIESHTAPDQALSDAAQQVTPEELAGITANLVLRAEASAGDRITALRRQIDLLDGELLELLSKRMNVAMEIGHLKKEANIPVLQPERYENLMKSRVDEAAALGLDRRFISALLAAIHAESVNRQLAIEEDNGPKEV